jgi:hypothetical protein
VFVHLHADEIHTQAQGRDRARSQSEERVHHQPGAFQAVQPQAHFRKSRGKSRRMRPILLTILYGLVRDEPCIPAAPDTRRSGAPAADVRLVLIPDTDRLPIERGVTARAEMEHELMAVVQEPFAVDRLVVSDRQVLLQFGAGPGE